MTTTFFLKEIFKFILSTRSGSIRKETSYKMRFLQLLVDSLLMFIQEFHKNRTGFELNCLRFLKLKQSVTFMANRLHPFSYNTKYCLSLSK